MNVAAKLPQTTDPCGKVQWEAAANEDQHVPVTRIDYQMTGNQLIFGRYMGTKQTIPAAWTGPGDNILKTSTAGTNDQLHALVLGQTHVMSAAAVNAMRFTYNSTNSRRGQNPGFFSPGDVGVKMYSYPPGDQFPLTVSNNFDINSGGATLRR